MDNLKVLFTGKPGSGKTTYGKRLGRILADDGYIVIYAEYFSEDALKHEIEISNGKVAVIYEEQETAL